MKRALLEGQARSTGLHSLLNREGTRGGWCPLCSCLWHDAPSLGLPDPPNATQSKVKLHAVTLLGATAGVRGHAVPQSVRIDFFILVPVSTKRSPALGGARKRRRRLEEEGGDPGRTTDGCRRSHYTWSNRCAQIRLDNDCFGKDENKK